MIVCQQPAYRTHHLDSGSFTARTIWMENKHKATFFTSQFFELELFHPICQTPSHATWKKSFLDWKFQRSTLNIAKFWHKFKKQCWEITQKRQLRVFVNFSIFLQLNLLLSSSQTKVNSCSICLSFSIFGFQIIRH